MYAQAYILYIYRDRDISTILWGKNEHTIFIFI